jgi:hypothetical protein
MGREWVVSGTLRGGMCEWGGQIARDPTRAVAARAVRPVPLTTDNGQAARNTSQLQPPTTLCAGNAAAAKGSLANAAKCLLSTDEGASANSEQNVQCIESICAPGSFVLALEA